MTKKEFSEERAKAMAAVERDGWAFIKVAFKTRKASEWYGNDLDCYLNDYDEYDESMEIHATSEDEVEEIFGRIKPRDLRWADVF